MMKKRILITGANGFIGRSLINGFDRKLYDIFALDCHNQLSHDIHGVKTYFSVDIRKPFHLPTDFDFVIHLAALNRTHIDCNFSYEQFKEVNVDGTINMAGSCGFQKFILFSTVHIYDKTIGPIDENASLKPVSFYECSKYEAELACKKYIDHEKLVILRPVNITGLKQENMAIVPFFFSQAVRHEPIEVFVPQNRRIQLLSIKDLFRAIETIIQREHIAGTFNLAGSDNIEVKELAEKIVALCNSDSLIRCTNHKLENYAEIVSDKAKYLLNWQAQDSIETIIYEYAQFFAAHIHAVRKGEST